MRTKTHRQLIELRVRDSSGKPGAPSSARGLAAPRYVSGSPTALPPDANSGVNAGTPKKATRTTIDLLFKSLEFEGFGNAAVRNSFYLSVKKWIDAAAAIGSKKPKT